MQGGDGNLTGVFIFFIDVPGAAGCSREKFSFGAEWRLSYLSVEDSYTTTAVALTDLLHAIHNSIQ
jgi:hypothetical protein